LLTPEQLESRSGDVIGHEELNEEEADIRRHLADADVFAVAVPNTDQSPATVDWSCVEDGLIRLHWTSPFF